MEPFEVLLWPDGPTYVFRNDATEAWTDDDVMPRPGVVNRVVRNVTTPTLKVFPAPADRATGAAMIVAPGGGMHAGAAGGRLFPWAGGGVFRWSWRC